MLNVEAVSTGSALRVDAAAADLDTLAAELGGLGSRIETLKAKVSRSGGEKSGAGAKAKPEANPDHVDDHTPEKPADPILMHVVVRADLVPGLGWPVGSVVTQACHVRFFYSLAFFSLLFSFFFLPLPSLQQNMALQTKGSTHDVIYVTI